MSGRDHGRNKFGGTLVVVNHRSMVIGTDADIAMTNFYLEFGGGLQAGGRVWSHVHSAHEKGECAGSWVLS